MFLMMPVCVYLVKKFRVNVNADEDKGALLRSLLLISQNGKHKGVWKLRSLVHHQKLRMNVNVDNDKGQTKKKVREDMPEKLRDKAEVGDT